MKALKLLLGVIYVILIVLLLLLTRCNKGDEPENETTKTEEQAREIGHSGDLKITLLWDFYADIDLHVKQPNGVELFWNKKTDDSTGGALDVDNVDGGKGSAENIYWESPPNGEYVISVNYYGESKLNDKEEAGICTIVVFMKGENIATYKVGLSHISDSVNVAVIKY